MGRISWDSCLSLSTGEACEFTLSSFTGLRVQIRKYCFCLFIVYDRLDGFPCKFRLSFHSVVIKIRSFRWSLFQLGFNSHSTDIYFAFQRIEG